MSALHTAPVAQTALTGAIDDVCRLASICGAADPQHVQTLCAIADACDGWSYDELAGEYGHQLAQHATAVVGSFFGKLGRGLGKIAKGVVKTAVPMAASFVPGGSAALRAARSILPGRRPSPPSAAPRHSSPAPAVSAPQRAQPAPPSPFAAVDTQGRTTVVHIHGF
jgi:hypothetical protein